MISITLPQAMQFILQKNYLAHQQAHSVPQIVKSIAGLPADSLTTPFLAARARLSDFKPDDLQTALEQPAGFLKSALMRSAPYVITAEHYPTYYAATARQRKKDFNAEFRLWGIADNAEIEKLGDMILTVVGAAPLSAEAIMTRLPVGAVKKYTHTSRGGRVTETTNVELALRWLGAQAQLYTANISSDWHSERLVFGHFADKYPDIDLADLPSEAEAQKELVHRYLAAFGPVTEADISFWTGFGKSETARATGVLARDIMLTMVQGSSGILLSLKSQVDTLKVVEPPAEPVISVLPADDPFITAHRASRARYFSDQKLQRRVFNSVGAAKPTILVNGQVVGLWSWEPNDESATLTWQLLTAVDAAVEALIEAEIEQVAAFVGAEVVRSESA
ncbi:MAG: AlkZ family DNA glycosylase [Anaerolineae bacterium]|nr:AlkZ family DNA glycosylase [Anaerolineae bacterium]